MNTTEEMPKDPNPESPAAEGAKPAATPKAESAQARARAALAATLQVMIRSQVPESDALRLATENLFERVRHEKFAPALLALARDQVRAAATALANHTPTGQANLAEIRGLASTFGKFADGLLTPPAA